MANTRSYTQRDLKMLWGRSAGTCAFPKCRESLSPVDSEALIGEIAHIVAVAPNGPRGDQSYPQDRLNVYENLILLCPTHHRLIDDGRCEYSADDLRNWKETHENWVSQRLNQGEPWKSNISQAYYYNIPRLGILAAQHGFMIESSILDPGLNLMDYGLELNALRLGLERLLSSIELRAIPLGEASDFSNDLVGALVSFEGEFRTKSVPSPHKLSTFQMQGNSSKDPHIYKRFKDKRLVMTINPKWIATTTGFCELTSGNFRGAGIGFVKRWDPTLKDLFASPLIIGFPKSPHDLFL